MSAQTSMECYVCKLELTDSFVRNICRHRFHRDCFEGLVRYCPGDVLHCAYCREEFPDKMPYVFEERPMSNTATMWEMINELENIITYRKQTMGRNDKELRINKKFALKLKECEKELVREYEEIREKYVRVIRSLYQHIGGNEKCRFAIENVDKICRCGPKRIELSALNLLKNNLKETRTARQKLARQGELYFLPQQMSMNIIKSFSPEECCDTCNRPELPWEIIEFYLDGFSSAQQ